MAPVLVDSNILIDIFSEDAKWFSWSASALEQAAQTRRLVINPVIYAEISVGYDKIEIVDAILPDFIDREPISYEAAFLAGKVFQLYRKRGGRRRSALPDFFVGAHAATAGYELLTRDVSKYRGYFPTVRLLSPE